MHATAADYMTDIVQNAVEAGASRITVRVTQAGALLTIQVEDNGAGIDQATLQLIRDPYTTTGVKHLRRRAGLGLAFVAQAAEQCGGRLAVDSTPGRATAVSCDFDLSHIDAPPLGDISLAAVAAMNMAGEAEVIFERVSDDSGYQICSSRLAGILGNLSEAANLRLARDYIRSAEAELMEGSRTWAE
jgi:hypothetical protein